MLVLVSPAHAQHNLRVDSRRRRARARTLIVPTPPADTVAPLRSAATRESGTLIVTVGNRIARHSTATPNQIELPSNATGPRFLSGGSWQARLLRIPRLGR
jgi:hypothetical protein